MLNIILLSLYVIIIFVCIIARIKNICEKNEDTEKIGDIIQILILGSGTYYIIGIINIYKILIVLIISFIIANTINFIFKKIKKKKNIQNNKTDKKNCKDCNPYTRWD